MTGEKDVFWLRHDCNARRDPKILRVRGKYGARGYGIFWMVVEILREQSGYSMAIDDIEVLCLEVGETAELVNEVIQYCFTVGLFESDGTHWYSPSLRRRMESWDEKREALREAGRRGGIAKAKRASSQAKATPAEKPSQAKASLKPPSSYKSRSDQSTGDQSTGEGKAADAAPLPSYFDASSYCETSGRYALVKYPNIYLRTDELKQAHDKWLKSGMSQDQWKDGLARCNAKMEAKRNHRDFKGGAAFSNLTGYILDDALRQATHAITLEKTKNGKTFGGQRLTTTDKNKQVFDSNRGRGREEDPFVDVTPKPELI